MDIPPVLRSATVRRLLVYAKIAGILLLIALLHIPLFMTQGVLRERQTYRAQAAADITGTWGRQQIVTGPVLAIPYVYRATVSRSKTVGSQLVQVDEVEDIAATAYFLPEALAIRGTVNPDIRHRGIYDVVVYETSLRLSGHFQPSFVAAGIVAERIEWEKSEILLGVSDLRGVRTAGPVEINGTGGVAIEAADAGRHGGLGLAARAATASDGARLEFAANFVLQGSERLGFAPVGRQTTVELTSPWSEPAFGGAYLPIRRDVAAGGFSAAWAVSHFSRGFGQTWTSRETELNERRQKIEAAAFNVGFTHAVDGYRLVERAQKYGVLFFVLVFTAFFLFETTAGLQIHPLHYLLVGAALCLFFLGFLALSEFLPAGVAYGVAAGVCTVMISLYAWSFLRTGRRTLSIGGSLATTYGVLYFVLQSQDYALLAGTITLFVGLALVMYLTRRINWGEIATPAASAIRP